MATLGSAAQYLSRDALAMWLLETDPWRNDFAAAFPYMPIDGPALKVARQAKVAIGSLAQPLDCNAPIADSTPAPTASSPAPPITKPPRAASAWRPALRPRLPTATASRAIPRPSSMPRSSLSRA